jgi:hypothetical protein
VGCMQNADLGVCGRNFPWKVHVGSLGLHSRRGLDVISPLPRGFEALEMEEMSDDDVQCVDQLYG